MISSLTLLSPSEHWRHQTESLPLTWLALPISTIELLAKAFLSPMFTFTITHFYLMLISPSSRGDLRIQQDISYDYVNGILQPNVM